MSDTGILQIDSLEDRLLANELNRYFTGKYMAARDFACDQEYFRSRFRSLSLSLAGWGIVDGLQVVRHQDETCTNWVVVKAGIAVDPVGRQIVLDRDVPVLLEPEREVMLGIRLVEQGVEPAPVLIDDPQAGSTGQQAGRVRELPEILSCAPGQLASNAWFGPLPWESPGENGTLESGVNHLSLFYRTQNGPEDAALPSSAHIVPLAYVRWSDTGQASDADPSPDLVMAGRRCLTGDNGTRITALNWRHGGDLRTSDLAAWDGTFMIAFSAPLFVAEEDGVGPGPGTLHLSYVDDDGVVRRIKPAKDARWYVTHDTAGMPAGADSEPGAGIAKRAAHNALWAAAFKIDPAQVRDLHEKTVEIRLNCDLIPDHLGQPVVGSSRPSGFPVASGRPGGIFESWVRVIYDGFEPTRSTVSQSPQQAV